MLKKRAGTMSLTIIKGKFAKNTISFNAPSLFSQY